MKILIIGGSRFIGPILIQKLLKRQHQLYVFNRGINESHYSKKITFIQGDRNKPIKINRKFDVVIDTCSYNAKQSKNAIEYLNFDFFIHFSTAAVYKKPSLFPLTEESEIGPWEVWGDYNLGKVEAEKYLTKTKISYATLRPVYILGPKNYINREHFIYHKLKTNQEITLPGNGQAVIQFVFASEVAECLVKLAEKKKPGNFNCAGDQAVTLEGLVLLLAKITRTTPHIKFDPKTDGTNHNPDQFPFANENFFVSNQKIKQALGIKFTPMEKELTKDYQRFYGKKNENIS